jgi:hypothetical protein
MIDPLDPKIEQKLREIATGKALPTGQRDAFAAGDKVFLYPEQIMSALRSAYVLGAAEKTKAPTTR